MPLRTVGQVLYTYHDRPEHKSLSPDGTPAGPTTAGRLRRRPVRSAPALTAHIGKEGNRLLERAIGEINDPSDYRTTYQDPEADQWQHLVLPVLQAIRNALGTKHIADRIGVTDRQVRNWLAGHDRPHGAASGNRQRAERLASDWASQKLRAAGQRVPADPYATLYAYSTCPSS